MFVKLGIETYLSSFLGGSLPKETCSLLLRRTAQLLNWVAIKLTMKPCLPPDTIPLFQDLFGGSKLDQMGSFVLFLKERMLLSAATILIWLNDFRKLAEWSYSVSKLISPLSFDLYKRASLNMGNSLRKENRKRKLQRTRKSLINELKLPATGGISALQSAVLKKAQHFEYLLGTNQILIISKSQYNTFMRFLYSAIYTGAVQGRVSGVEDLKVSQGRELLSHGHAYSSKFKTVSVYGYQPIILGTLSYKYFQIYLNVMRPLISKGRCDEEDDPLWLTYDATRETNVSRLVTSFFQDSMCLNITTTMIRSLIETETEELMEKGNITSEERRAVEIVNGHSSAITKEYYVKRNLHRQVGQARKVLDMLTSETCGREHTEFPFLVPFPSKPFESVAETGKDWGSRHPQYQCDEKKIKWTHEELSYLGSTGLQLLRKNEKVYNNKKTYIFYIIFLHFFIEYFCLNFRFTAIV